MMDQLWTEIQELSPGQKIVIERDQSGQWLIRFHPGEDGFYIDGVGATLEEAIANEQ